MLKNIKRKEMKRIFVSALLLLLSTIAFAQTPSVTTTIDNVTTTTITASFDMDENCTKYHILASAVGEMDQWTQMFGMPLRDLVISWSIGCESDTTYTWTDMIPNTDYIVYVVAVNATDTSDVLMTTCTTQQGGGEGASVVSLELSSITETSVILTATPNDQTTRFLDGIVEKAYYDEVGQDSLLAVLIQEPYWLYETDIWEWLDLTPGMEYYAFGIGQNANEQWGEMTLVPFTTLVSGLNEIDAPKLTLFPNPATKFVTLTNLPTDSNVELIDNQARVLQSFESKSSELKLETSDLESGIYYIRIKNKVSGKETVEKLIIND